MNRSEDDLIREFPELLHAIEEAPPSGAISLPASLLSSLERERREALERRSRSPRWRHTLSIGLALAAALAVMLVGRQFFQPGPRPGEIARVTITSPGDLITTTQPRIAWNSKDRASQRYDVWILPEEGEHREVPALFEAKSVVSPIQLTSPI